MTSEMKQAQIQFFPTMVSPKRGAGAYLRKNMLTSDDEGFYPAIDFTEKEFGAVSGADKGYLIFRNYVFVDDGGTTKVYYNTGAAALVFRVNMPDNSDPVAVAQTSESDKILVLLEDGKLYSVQNTTVTLIYDFSVIASSAYMVYNGFFWFISIDTKIYRLDPDLVTVTVVKNTTGTDQNEIINMQMFGKYIVMTRRLGDAVQFDFWDVDEGDVDLYQKRVTEENCRHLAMGDVDGTLIFVKAVGDNANAKEKQGDIVVSGFDGEKFVKLNSIRAFSETVTTQISQSQSIGNGIMILAIAGNNDDDITLAKNWVLKIRNKGEIETIFEPNDIEGGIEVKAVNIEYSFTDILLEKTGGKDYYYHTKDTDNAYKDYQNYSSAEYITNMLNNSKNVHKLESFAVSFEKVFEQVTATTGERLYIDYRTSERDDWRLLHEVTSATIKDYTADVFSEALREVEYDSDTTGQTIQSYVIKKMPDGSELPRYNEIQFRFRSEKGFSLLQAWYNYAYIKRNTL